MCINLKEPSAASKAKSRCKKPILVRSHATSCYVQSVYDCSSPGYLVGVRNKQTKTPIQKSPLTVPTGYQNKQQEKKLQTQAQVLIELNPLSLLNSYSSFYFPKRCACNFIQRSSCVSLGSKNVLPACMWGLMMIMILTVVMVIALL